MKGQNRPELVCPAGTPAGLRAAISAGADAVYCGFRDETNARNFPGLNFSREEMEESIAYAHDRETKVLVAINTFPHAGKEEPWHRAVADSARMGADAVILVDLGLLAYAAKHYPHLRRHLSVQAAGANADAISFYVREFGVRRVVLPRVLTVEEIIVLNGEVECETEVSPHSCDMVAVANTFREALDNRIDPAEARTKVAATCGSDAFVNGFLFGSSGLEFVDYH